MSRFSDSCVVSDTDEEYASEEETIIKKNILLQFPALTSSFCPLNYSLSFLQKDKYLYEFGYLLKTKYPETEQQWRDLKNISDTDYDKEPCEGFEEIDDKLIKGTLTLDLHFKAANILSEVFDKLIDFINYEKNIDCLDERIKILTAEYYIYHKTYYVLKNKFFVDLDYSSFVYNERTKLYSFNQKKTETIESLKEYISGFKKEIESVYDYFSYSLNIKIMDSILTNMKSGTVLVAILDMLKEKINFSFNDENKFEIAYDDKILNLKTWEVVERTHKHYFTRSVNARYLKYIPGFPGI